MAIALTMIKIPKIPNILVTSDSHMLWRSDAKKITHSIAEGVLDKNMRYNGYGKSDFQNSPGLGGHQLLYKACQLMMLKESIENTKDTPRMAIKPTIFANPKIQAPWKACECDNVHAFMVFSSSNTSSMNKTNHRKGNRGISTRKKLRAKQKDDIMQKNNEYPTMTVSKLCRERNLGRRFEKNLSKGKEGWRRLDAYKKNIKGCRRSMRRL